MTLCLLMWSLYISIYGQWLLYKFYMDIFLGKTPAKHIQRYFCLVENGLKDPDIILRCLKDEVALLCPVVNFYFLVLKLTSSNLLLSTEWSSCSDFEFFFYRHYGRMIRGSSVIWWLVDLYCTLNCMCRMQMLLKQSHSSHLF